VKKEFDMDLNQISTIFFDVDGVFTDGSLYISDNEVTITKFNVHDGMGCILLKEAGLELLILTARHNNAVVKRFKDLGINKIYTNVLKKRDFIREYSKTHNLAKKQIAMMGDDLQDLAAIDEVGLFFTTPDAINTVKDSAHYITKKLSGNGAVREICDLIILSRGLNSCLEFQHYVEKR
jgi:3-deoxy-D-manno-octulosonate 8-phosphate phosphatase (KDO 8-P phosphatase)